MTVPSKFSWLLALLLALAGCTQMPRPAPLEERSAAPSRWIGHHVVSRGETLFSIAWRYGLDFRQLAAANDIEYPYAIRSGRKLVLPAPNNTSAAAPKRAAEAVGRDIGGNGKGPAKGVATARSSGSKQYKNTTRDPFDETSLTAWRWPANGVVVQRFAEPDAGHKGIDIRGELGQPVCAANNGKVVYAGNGLLGYGNLLIIKHDDQYLSAYAHNSRLLVGEGKVIKAGDRIAEIGDSGTDSVKLHFEIRRNGEPVDPLELLPRRRPTK